MLRVHHLNESRSQRILWLLEELGVPYEIAYYYRDAHKMAPSELRAVHPLGKSPVISDGGVVVAESGAIVDYLIRHYGRGRLQPGPSSPEYDIYVQWLHYAEGSASLPFTMQTVVQSFGKIAAPLARRVAFELNLNLSYINDRLANRQYLLGDMLTAADIQMSFVGELATTAADIASYPNIDRWVARFQSRPAYLAAIERGGSYQFQRQTSGS